MADFVITSAEKLLDHAVSSALSRRSSRMRLMVQILRAEIPTIRDVVEDAETQQLHNENVREWLDSIKDAFIDVIDAVQEMKSQEERKARFLGLPPHLSNVWGQYVVAKKIGYEIERIQDLSRKRYSLGLGPSSTQDEAQSSQKERSDKSSFHEDAACKTGYMIDELGLLCSKVYKWVSQSSPQAQAQSSKVNVKRRELYGRDNDTKDLISKLTGVVKRDIQCLSIVGVAGVGKTSLAEAVFTSSKVEECFTLKVWVSVSHAFNLLGIAMAIVETITYTKIDKVELESLFQRIRQIIGGKRYLIVLDDVCNEDISKWEQLKEFLNCGAPGSSILITTRSEAVARIAGSRLMDIINLTSVLDKDCWLIFRDAAFGSIDEQHIDKEYIKLGEAFVKRCNGLPRAARCLGSFLSGRSVQEWLDAMHRYTRTGGLINNATEAMNASMFSYSNLPPELRQCLLYCAVFPRNHYIDIDKLIKLWIAQGFVASDQDELEREVWRYFKALLDYSIFQEFKQEGSSNFKCRLEGGMRDLIDLLTQKECHIIHFDDENMEHQDNRDPSKTRHCTITVAPQASLSASIASIEKLHTLMILSEYSRIDPATLASLLSNMRRLRALDLSFCCMKELSPKVGELLHLRYLDLSFNRDLKKLPKAICNLFKLQVLNLNGCDDLRKLPKGIGKLTKLRHLEILWTTKLSYLPKGVSCLLSLRTLNRFFGSSGVGSKASNLGDLEKLNFLQGYISIDALGGETDVSHAEKADLKNKKHLRGLELWFSVVGSEMKDQNVLQALEPPADLKCLGIFYYRGKLFPNWLTALEKLTHLMLADCSKCESLPPLGQLPSLESLEIKNVALVKKVGSEFLGIGLDHANGGEEGSSSTVAFPKLKKLRFQMLNAWEEWVGMMGIEGHANIMPSLSSLSIVSCAKLRALPDYIKSKKNLNTIIEECPFLKENSDDRE